MAVIAGLTSGPQKAGELVAGVEVLRNPGLASNPLTGVSEYLNPGHGFGAVCLSHHTSS